MDGRRVRCGCCFSGNGLRTGWLFLPFILWSTWLGFRMTWIGAAGLGGLGVGGDVLQECQGGSAVGQGSVEGSFYGYAALV